MTVPSAPVRTVAVLFARRDSVYKTLPGTDVWDEDRDAIDWPGGSTVVAHPPCGHWGRLSTFCKQPKEQKAFAIWAVCQVRKHGGVLEHPATSRLFSRTALAPYEPLPAQGDRDIFGGFTVYIQQWWFGHLAEKSTLLYICGCEPKDIPEIPIKLGDAPYVIGRSRNRVPGHPQHRPCVTHERREHTTIALAEWLLETARRCKPPTP